MTTKDPHKRADKGDKFDDDSLPNKIGKNLKQIYDDVLNEPVPDDFLSLLMKADEKQSKK
ncbi:MAG: NepR family anti-sigma factor [Alphaproteobacteria bacterium]